MPPTVRLKLLINLSEYALLLATPHPLPIPTLTQIRRYGHSPTENQHALSFNLEYPIMTEAVAMMITKQKE